MRHGIQPHRVVPVPHHGLELQWHGAQVRLLNHRPTELVKSRGSVRRRRRLLRLLLPRTAVFAASRRAGGQDAEPAHLALEVVPEKDEL